MTPSSAAIWRRPARARWAAPVVALAVAIALVGCSSETVGEPSVAQGSPSESITADDTGDSTDDATEADDSSQDAEAGLDVAEDLDGDSLPDAPAITDLNDFFGSGGCMAAAGILMGWGMALIGPLTEGTELLQPDVDALFEASTELPAEIQPHIAVLRDAMNASVGKPQAQVIEIVGSPKVNEAMEALTAHSDAACDTVG